MALDKVKEVIQQTGHRAEEAGTAFKHDVQQTQDRGHEVVNDAARSAQETTTQLGNRMEESSQKTSHKTKGLFEKIKHRLGFHGSAGGGSGM